jgi:hypothetical protein
MQIAGIGSVIIWEGAGSGLDWRPLRVNGTRITLTAHVGEAAGADQTRFNLVLRGRSCPG